MNTKKQTQLIYNTLKNGDPVKFASVYSNITNAVINKGTDTLRDSVKMNLFREQKEK